MEQLDIFSTVLTEESNTSNPKQAIKEKVINKEAVVQVKEKSNLHNYLDAMVEKYKIPEFITNDPLRFGYRYTNFKDQEVMCFIAAMMSQGKRTSIVTSLEKLENMMDKSPYKFVTEFDFDIHAERFKDFNHFAYKNIPGTDIVAIIFLLKQVLNQYGSIKNLFLEGLDPSKQKNVKEALIYFTEKIFSFAPPPDMLEIPSRIKSLLPNPNKGSACKRLNMFLRWVVRKDNVDIGIWSEVPTSMLLIPLDFHVSKLSRELGLTSRKQDDWKTAEEITERLKQFDPNDPAKYDFAIFGMGIAGERPFVPQ